VTTAKSKSKSKAKEARPVVPRRRRLGSGVACLVLLGLTLAALGHVAVQARHLDVALALGKEQKIQGDLYEQRRKLKSQIGRLKDPARLSTLARDALKLAPVAPTDIVAVRPGVSIVAPRPLAFAPAAPNKGKRP
jgi:cell division protein FtsL